MLLSKEEIKEKMKILAITKVFKTIKNASAFIIQNIKRRLDNEEAFCCRSISLLSINKEKP